MMKKIQYWSNHYYGEDVLHDVTVGLEKRKVMFIDTPLCIAHIEEERL